MLAPATRRRPSIKRSQPSREAVPLVLAFVSLLAAGGGAFTSGCAAAPDESDGTGSDESDLTKHSLMERLAGNSKHFYRGFELEGDPSIQLVLSRERIKAPIREFLELPNFRVDPDVINVFERDFSQPSRHENWSQQSAVTTKRLPKGVLGQIELHMQQSVLFLGTQRPQPAPRGENVHFRVDVLKVDDQRLILRTPAGKVLTFRAIELDHVW